MNLVLERKCIAVLLVDASNAFNSVNRNLFLHNVKIVCPEITTYVRNCYIKSSRLFIIGGHEMRSSEGTTQGDPIAMAIYAIAVVPLILMTIQAADKLPDKRTKMAAYADDFSAGGSVENIKHWWNILCELGPKFGYFPTKFIPAITDGMIINEDERKLLSLPLKSGGLGIPIFAEISSFEYENSIAVTESLTTRIVLQEHHYKNDAEIKKKKNAIKNKEQKRNEKIIDMLRFNLRSEQIRLLEISRDPGASSWLSMGGV